MQQVTINNQKKSVKITFELVLFLQNKAIEKIIATHSKIPFIFFYLR